MLHADICEQIMIQLVSDPAGRILYLRHTSTCPLPSAQTSAPLLCSFLLLSSAVHRLILRHRRRHLHHCYDSLTPSRSRDIDLFHQSKIRSNICNEILQGYHDFIETVLTRNRMIQAILSADSNFILLLFHYYFFLVHNDGSGIMFVHSFSTQVIVI